ncbi:MAG: hypothetical protein M1376_20540 [Planctomycetes bacterium]|nr:hypothetical protein [Planctomycetota bacterium]
MSKGIDIVPLVIVPLSFLFVLLIILIVKAPKTGAWLLGGLILLSPLAVLGFVKSSLSAHADATALVVVPLSFLFVLLIILLTKAPKAGTVLIVMLLVMGLFGLFFRFGHISQRPIAVARIEMSAPPAMTLEIPPIPNPSIPTPSIPTPQVPVPPVSATLAPIWSPGIEKEMDADIYPSKLSAIRALGSRLDKSVRALVGDVNEAPRIILFQQELDRALVVELKDAIGQVLPQAACRIEAEQKNLNPGEVGVAVHLTDLDMQPAPWLGSSKIKVASGTISLIVSTTTGGMSLQGRFAEKPWIDNFATFASNRPDQAFIVARSTGTCTSESEARQQALWDASQQVGHIVWNRRPPSGPPARDAALISPSDLERNGLVADTFVQSFEGSVGKIWRQAVLLDVSGAKISQLYRLKSVEVRRARESWARMGLSAVGVVVLIGVIYFFLNMATMGYYEWSLRIASVVLAIVGVLSILMVVH